MLHVDAHISSTLSVYLPKLDLLSVYLLILKIFKTEKVNTMKFFIFYFLTECHANFLYSNLSRNYVKEPNFGGGYSVAGK